jgi:4-amino-4-deoxy-L-arabinose transferase-like glycosyltransferase
MDSRRTWPTAEWAALVTLFVLAIGLRWPYLQDIPRFTDELQEVLWGLSISRGEMLPLTAVDSYYGPLWSYLLAGLFALFGPSPTLPRLMAMLLSAALVPLTYFFARDVAGRWPAFIAAGLLLTSGGHIVINSHTARSNSLTPLLTTGALWLVYRALADRSFDFGAGSATRRQADPRLLVPAGLLFGFALQTHLSVIAFLPGVGLYVLWQRLRRSKEAPDQPSHVSRGNQRLLARGGILRSPWPYLGLLAAVVGYSNMIIYNLLNDFWSLRHASSLHAGYTGGRSTDAAFYLSNLGNLLQSLSRLLSGTIERPDSPSRFLYVVLAAAGLALLARRGGGLLPLAALSVIAVLPYFNPRYGPILSGRYLVPLLPLAFAAIGCVVVVTSRKAARWQYTAALAGLALVIFPLFPLHHYYQEAAADGRTNQPLYQLVDAVIQARQADEIVLLDEGLGQEQLGAGGTDLKAFRMLLGTRGIPYVVTKVGEADELPHAGAGSFLIVMESKKRSSLPRGLRSVSLSPEVPSASGSDHRYAVYRVSPR